MIPRRHQGQADWHPVRSHKARHVEHGSVQHRPHQIEARIPREPERLLHNRRFLGHAWRDDCRVSASNLVHHRPETGDVVIRFELLFPGSSGVIDDMLGDPWIEVFSMLDPVPQERALTFHVQDVAVPCREIGKVGGESDFLHFGAGVDQEGLGLFPRGHDGGCSFGPDMCPSKGKLGSADLEGGRRGRCVVCEAEHIGDQVEIVDMSGVDANGVACDGVCDLSMAASGSIQPYRLASVLLSMPALRCETSGMIAQ